MMLAPTIAALDVEPKKAFDGLHQAGFRAVQISATQPGLKPRELDGSGRRDLLAIMRRHELTIAGIDFWIPLDHFQDPMQIDRAIGATHQAIELAADLGRIPLSLTLPVQSEDDPNNGAKLVDSALVSITSHAERFGVMIADHAYPVASLPWVGVGFDPAATLGRGESPARLIATLEKPLVSTRLCDLLNSGMRGPVGEDHEGQLDVTEYRAALSVSGYERPVVLDARQWKDPWTGMLKSREAWEAADLF